MSAQPHEAQAGLNRLKLNRRQDVQLLTCPFAKKFGMCFIEFARMTETF